MCSVVRISSIPVGGFEPRREMYLKEADVDGSRLRSQSLKHIIYLYMKQCLPGGLLKFLMKTLNGEFSGAVNTGKIG